MTHISCCQLAPRLGDLAGNQKRILDTIAKHTAAGTDVLVLPELATSGYLFTSPAELDTCAIPNSSPLIAEWVRAVHSAAVVVVGFAERGDDGHLYNSAAVLDATGVLATYRKAHLWDNEKTLFTPGSQPPPVVTTRHGRIGVLVCYDLEFPEFTRLAALNGAELLAVPTNWPLVDRPAGEHPPEVVIAQAAARVNRVVVACCDRSGTERGQEWTEGTTIVDENGWIAATAGPAGVARAELSLARSRNKATSARNDVFEDRRTELYAPRA